MNVQDELILRLKPYIDSGSIAIDRNVDKYFRAVEDVYPLCGSKIDWSKVPGTIEKSAPLDQFVTASYRFFCDEVERHNLKGEVCILGDSAIDVALVMSIDTLRECLRALLDVPQHLYVVAKDMSWCMAFTMEGDIAFGFRPAT